MARSAEKEPLILASRSPRRTELLRLLGLRFEVQPSRANEGAVFGESSEQRAIAAAHLKADEVSRRFPDRLVLGADTIVCLGDRVLGKPRDRAEARRMLLALRGRWHVVVTGLCLIAPGRWTWTAAESTRVKMADFCDDDLEQYLATDEPLDKAGGYAIQGDAARFVEAIDGDYYNVVGLPLALLLEGLSRYMDTKGLVIPPPPGRFARRRSGG